MAETTEKAAKAAKVPAEPKPEITISTKEIIDMLNRGIDRKGIAKHYGVPQSVIKRIFDNTASLKGKKTKPTAQFTLIDDAAGETAPKVVTEGASTDAPVANTATGTPAVSEAAAPEAQPQVQQAGQW